MAGREDYSRAVDIVAQSLQDIRQKPFYDSHINESDFGTISSSGNQTLILYTGKGILLNASILLTSINDNTLVYAIAIDIDGIQFYSQLVNNIRKDNIFSPGYMVRLTHESDTNGDLKFIVNGGFMFNTSIKVRLNLGVGISLYHTTDLSLGIIT